MSPADWVGVIGGIAGFAALAVQGYALWLKRRPALNLFVPYHFTGDEPNSKQRVLFALVRISNTSERPAHLYLETLRAEVLFKGRWYQMSVLSFAPHADMHFDLPEPVQHYAGLKYFKLFNKFDGAVIPLDHPYSRYLGLAFHDPSVVNNAERLRFEVKDCNLVKYTVEADILKNDPEHSDVRV
jgi:hypothetical protein